MNAIGQWKTNHLTDQKPTEVGLSEFAAICGLTEQEFYQKMFEKLKEGKFVDLLKPEAQNDFFNWASSLKLQEKEITFVIRIRLSMNRTDDTALYCLSKIDMMGDEFGVKVLKTVPGMTSLVPDEMKSELGFEVGFCDFDTTMGD